MGAHTIWPAEGQKRILLDASGKPGGSEHTAVLTSTGDGFAGLVIPPWADWIELDYSIRPNTSISWTCFAMPDGTNTNVYAARAPGQTVQGAAELSNVVLAFNAETNRQVLRGRCRLDVFAGIDKGFWTESVNTLNTGAPTPAIPFASWRGRINRAERLSTFDIIGTTSGGALSNAFLADTWIDVYGVTK